MARIATITVEFHGDPELPADVAQAMLDEVLDAVNATAYVSDVEWVPSRPLAESEPARQREAVALHLPTD